MSEKTKKDDAPEGATKKKSLSVYNAGQRNIKLKSVNGAVRSLPPGASIQCVDEDEYNSLTRYRDVVDSFKMVPNIGAQVEQLEKEKAQLLAEKSALESEVSELRKKLDDKKGK